MTAQDELQERSIADWKAALLDSVRAGHGALQELLSSRSFPVIVEGTALFVFDGQAEQVLLHHWIFGLPSSQPFERVHGTQLWWLEADIQRSARVEYKLEVVHHGQQRLVRDPLNPALAQDPFGANSVATGSDYVVPEWAEEHEGTRRGKIIEREIQSEVFGGSRPLSIYLPARFRETRRYPLLVVHDGLDYLRFASLQNVLDNLIHRQEIPPMIVVLTQSPQRMEEYSGSDAHARFLAEEVLPMMEREYPLLEEAQDRALMGASFGAVASLHAAWCHPGTFGKLLLQSGSFAFTDIGDHDRGPMFDPVVKFVNAFREAPGKPVAQAFLSCGVYESLIYYNRSMLPLLQAAGVNARLVEAQDGHNWENWRDRLREGLTWLFAGPLWMVYE